MADVRIPRTKYSWVSQPSNNQKASKDASNSGRHYHLNILEQDPQNKLVKVRYVGYGSEFDEWRLESDVVHLTEESDSDSAGEEDSFNVFATLGIPSRRKFCLYEDLSKNQITVGFK